MDSTTGFLAELNGALDQLTWPKNRKLIVGLSGGIDSQALTHSLAQLASERQIELKIVHVDHGLREASSTDAQKVREFCDSLGLDCEVVAVDVDSWDKQLRQGTESAARAARYAALAKSASEAGTNVIATGHTLDDQAETVLLRLISGSGLEGLGAMDLISRRSIRIDPGRSRTRRTTIFRPLIWRRRAEVEEYASAVGLVPIEDASNDSLEFRRNAIRKVVLPELVKIEQSAAESISRTASLLRDDARLISDIVDELFESMCAERSGVWMVERAQFRQAHPAVQRRVLYRLIEPLLTPSARLSHERIEAVRTAAVEGRSGSTIELPQGLSSYVDYDRVAIGKADSLEDELRALSWIPLIDPGTECPLDGEVDLPLGNGWRVRGFVSPGTGLTLRTRRDGDRTRSKPRRGRTIKLQDWFVDRKVPQYVRDQLPVVERDGFIVWIIGLDITEFVDTERGIELHLELDAMAPIAADRSGD